MNVHNSKYSIYIIFQLCTFNVYNSYTQHAKFCMYTILFIECTQIFSNNLHNSVHSGYTNLQRMYAILYFQNIQNFKKYT